MTELTAPKVALAVNTRPSSLPGGRGVAALLASRSEHFPNRASSATRIRPKAQTNRSGIGPNRTGDLPKGTDGQEYCIGKNRTSGRDLAPLHWRRIEIPRARYQDSRRSPPFFTHTG